MLSPTVRMETRSRTGLPVTGRTYGVAEEFGPVRTEVCAVAEAATARTADAPIARVMRVISLRLLR